MDFTMDFTMDLTMDLAMVLPCVFYHILPILNPDYYITIFQKTIKKSDPSYILHTLATHANPTWSIFQYLVPKSVLHYITIGKENIKKDKPPCFRGQFVLNHLLIL